MRPKESPIAIALCSALSPDFNVKRKLQLIFVRDHGIGRLALDQAQSLPRPTVSSKVYVCRQGGREG